jgi:hypothetical protein
MTQRPSTITLSSKQYADQLYAIATEFYQTYIALAEDKSGRHDFIGMKYYTLCHALELTLKSLLIDTGNYNEPQLINKFGHDLEKAAKEVLQLYVSFNEVNACMGYIQVMNPDYKQKGYEYPINNGRFRGTETVQFARTVEALVLASAKSIHSYKYPDKPLP